jgi:hypothetical protein
MGSYKYSQRLNFARREGRPTLKQWNNMGEKLYVELYPKNIRFLNAKFRKKYNFYKNVRFNVTFTLFQLKCSHFYLDKCTFYLLLLE